MVTYGFAQTSALAFSQASALKAGDIARQYADLEAEVIKTIGFDKIEAEAVHTRRSMTPITGQNNDYESAVRHVSTVNLGEETGYVKIVNIDVFKKGENTPRYTLEIPVSKRGSSDESLSLKGKKLWEYESSATYNSGDGRNLYDPGRRTFYIAYDCPSNMLGYVKSTIQNIVREAGNGCSVAFNTGANSSNIFLTGNTSGTWTDTSVMFFRKGQRYYFVLYQDAGEGTPSTVTYQKHQVYSLIEIEED